MIRLLIALFVAMPLTLSSPTAAAQTAARLSGALTILVGYPPGGSTDRVARLIADRLRGPLGVPVIVENRPGAGGRLAAQATARAGARDNLLILANPAVMVIAPLVFQDVGYDVARDFALVSMVSDYSFAVAVPGTSSLTAMADLTATLRAGTTAFQVGVPATGSLPHFFALSLAERLGTPAQVIGYKGSGPLLVDLIGGHLPIAIDTFDALATQHAAGKVRLLATSGDRREALAPDVPTLRELGLGVEGHGWNALYAPSTMPAQTIDLLAREIRAVMESPELRRIVQEYGLNPISATREDSSQMLDDFTRRWSPLIRNSGVVLEQ